MGSKRILWLAGVIIIFAAGFGISALLRNNPSSSNSTTSANTSSSAPASGASLDYSGKGLTKFPKEILSRTDVTSLNLSNNGLTGALPAEIRQMSSLEVLDVSNNQMTGIPAEIGQLRHLRILNYANNQITGLPLELGNLTQLQTLDLSGNAKVSQYDLNLIRPKLPSTTIKL